MIVVTRINVTPVKGTALHHPDEVRIERTGVGGNRRFFFLDANTSRYKSSRLAPLIRVRADYDPRRDHLALRMPDGETVDGPAAPEGPGESVDLWGKTVVARPVPGPFGATASELLGRPVRLMRFEHDGDGNDESPVTLVSLASVAELSRRAGRAADGDGGRFRMTLEIDGIAPHEEDTWKGRVIRAGDAVLNIGDPVPRCVVTTWNPATGERDLDTLKVIEGYRGRTPEGLCFGVYADVIEPGAVRVGDPVEQEA